MKRVEEDILFIFDGTTDVSKTILSVLRQLQDITDLS